MTILVYLASLRVFFTISTIFFSHLFAWYLDSFVKLRKVRDILQSLVVVESIILSVTLLDSWIVYIVGFSAPVCGIILRSSCTTAKKKIEFLQKRPTCITLCRASVFLITAVSISAVDFPIFPSHLSKSKDCTPGLMDTGIGLFVFSIAITKQSVEVNSSFKALFKTVMPLLALGVMRTIILKITGYHQDVTEYGLHWNAFLTIGVTKLFGEVFCRLAFSKITLFTAVIILHEVILQSGLGNWVMNFEVGRSTFLEANREGIVSLPGFLAIYIASVHISNILTNKSTVSGQEFVQKRKQLEYFAIVIFLALVFVIPITRICRRTANMGYFLWIILIALVMLIIFMNLEICAITASETRSAAQQIVFELPMVTEAVNYNALFFFLISNVLTGVINMFFNTNGRSRLTSFIILNLYMSIVCSSVIYLYKRKQKIKW